MDQQEEKRIDEILKRMENQYPKNMATEKLLNEIFRRISRIDKAIIAGSTSTCKEETEELNKYATFNSNYELDYKKNIDEALFEKSLKNFQECLQNKHQDFHTQLHILDADFNKNNYDLNICIDDCTLGSKEKSEAALENCFFSCFTKFEENYYNLAKSNNEQIKFHEKKYFSDSL